MIIRPIVAYPILIIAGMIGFAIGGNIGNKSSVENTLKMCNQKPLECKFKYDILMYNETGKIPYTQEKVIPIKK